VHPPTQQVVDDLGTDLAAEALLDHLGRNLAGTKALDARGARHFTQATADLVVDIAGGEAEDDATLEVAGGFDRDLHDAMTPARVRVNPVAQLMISRMPGGGPAERNSFADPRASRHRFSASRARRSGSARRKSERPASRAFVGLVGRQGFEPWTY